MDKRLRFQFFEPYSNIRRRFGHSVGVAKKTLVGNAGVRGAEAKKMLVAGRCSLCPRRKRGFSAMHALAMGSTTLFPFALPVRFDQKSRSASCRGTRVPVKRAGVCFLFFLNRAPKE
ncbi:hypothetical protein V3391_00990 [Luteimonas sp. SMYT11W]|uniref:Uncharacterized protein n=1 Tax=Luteimonas flava TaxID=3115822 RepID=A0ABU7WA04_9GAMM